MAPTAGTELSLQAGSHTPRARTNALLRPETWTRAGRLLLKPRRPSPPGHTRGLNHHLSEVAPQPPQSSHTDPAGSPPVHSHRVLCRAEM